MYYYFQTRGMDMSKFAWRTMEIVWFYCYAFCLYCICPYLCHVEYTVHGLLSFSVSLCFILNHFNQDNNLEITGKFYETLFNNSVFSIVVDVFFYYLHNITSLVRTACTAFRAATRVVLFYPLFCF